MRRTCFILSLVFLFQVNLPAQLKWINVDSLYQPLPSSVHIYFTEEKMDSSPFRAYYLIADLNDKALRFDTDTSKDRRLRPSAFYERNDRPLVVVNCTFFSFETNKNLNIVIKKGEVVATNRVVRGQGRDSTQLYMPHLSAIGISKKRVADVAWIKADSTATTALATQTPPVYSKVKRLNKVTGETTFTDPNNFTRWKMETAVGGGPVVLQAGQVRITNEEEKRFTGKAIHEKHPRTAMGYTKDGKLVILMIEGRNKKASGATLQQEAQILKDLGCWEALNLDGGGSSCMLVNGKETIRVSDATGQRPVPAVFIIKRK